MLNLQKKKKTKIIFLGNLNDLFRRGNLNDLLISK